ncbi:MAG: UDP-N-acetylmuramoyl-tripeptide--D-alanyl-D-alanine ligase [Candidatus Omnitrophota bacterium]|jgi:UDP-N-acetylmuramoyl-tripeptide--D-alanyl-D-alanine ligase
MFKVTELLKATKGRLSSGESNTVVKSISIDSRTLLRGEAFLAIKGDNFDGHDFVNEAISRGAVAVILHKNVKIKNHGVCCIRVKNTTTALGDIARFHRDKFNIPVIAVTGSNGKTTAKEMIVSVLGLKGKVLKSPGTNNNHIGLPKTLLELNNTHNFAVVELGTNHSGEIEYLSGICKPDIAVITNVAASHLKHFGSLKGVLTEKYSIVDNLNKKGLVILNADDGFLAGKLKAKFPFKLSFGIKNKAEFRSGAIKVKGPKTEFTVNGKYKFALDTLGYYNIYNALCAIACGRIFGLSYDGLRQRLSGFVFPKGRLNLIEINRIKFIDDTYNSNPYSLKRALEALDAYDIKGRKIFVMGDMMELGKREHLFHMQAVKAALKVCNILITAGSLTKAAVEALGSGSAEKGRIFSAQTSRQARRILSLRIFPGGNDIVLVKGSRRMFMEEVLKI